MKNKKLKQQLSPMFSDLADQYLISLDSQVEMKLPLGRGKQGKPVDVTLFEIIRMEIYEFFCNEKSKYASLKKDIKKDTDLILASLCAGVAASLVTAGVSIGVTVIAAAVALLLKITLRIGTQSLCKYVAKYQI